MLKKLGRRWNELRHGDRLDREARDELALHLELAVAEKVRAGADASEARRQARLELGDEEDARERLREARSGFWLDSVRKDAAYALRMLRKRPAFSAACVLTIGLGVGASTALFAVVDAVVLRPLPLPEPATLVSIYDTNLSIGVERSGVATGNLADWRRRAPRFHGIAGHYTMGRTLTVGLESEVVLTAQVTEDFFPLLGVAAALGRTFTPEETAAALFNPAAAPLSPDPHSHGRGRRPCPFAPLDRRPRPEAHPGRGCPRQRPRRGLRAGRVQPSLRGEPHRSGGGPGRGRPAPDRSRGIPASGLARDPDRRRGNTARRLTPP